MIEKVVIKKNYILILRNSTFTTFSQEIINCRLLLTVTGRQKK